jgi:hypothetical protein
VLRLVLLEPIKGSLSKAVTRARDLADDAVHPLNLAKKGDNRHGQPDRRRPVGAWPSAPPPGSLAGNAADSAALAGIV